MPRVSNIYTHSRKQRLLRGWPSTDRHTAEVATWVAVDRPSDSRDCYVGGRQQTVRQQRLLRGWPSIDRQTAEVATWMAVNRPSDSRDCYVGGRQQTVKRHGRL